MPKRFYIVFVCFIYLSAFQLPAAADGLIVLKPWHVVRTRFTLIKYKHPDDLAAFHGAVRFGPPKWNKKNNLVNLADKEIETMAARKTDAIFMQAQAILDMKKHFNPVNIHLFPNTNALNNAFESIYGAECRLRAWYRFKNNTVYLNVQDLHEGMLAHELAHAIIDHYLTVRPPRQTAEILARYVDSHLDRGFIE